MKFVKFKGGLGNQLFQYVFLRRLELLFGQEVKADLSYYKGIADDDIRKPRIFSFNVKLNVANGEELKKVLYFNHIGDPKTLFYKIGIFVEKSLNRRYYFEKTREYIDTSKILGYTYYDGYWQSYKYACDVEREITNEVILSTPLTNKTKLWIDMLSRENAVFVGIRLGDYLDKKNRKIFGSISKEYYLRGMDTIRANVLNPTFLVFSNDINTVKEEFADMKNIFFFDDEVSDEEELIIRANCKHAIISNSTYNWWGAWLIPGNDKMVIAPKQWFADGRKIDIVPPDWITI